MILRTARSRSRLLINVLVLAISLVALSYSRDTAFADPAQCDEGCVNWNAEQGCVETMICCVFNDGCVMCWRNGVLVTDPCIK